MAEQVKLHEELLSKERLFMKGKYFPLSSGKVEGSLGSEHMSSLQRQAAISFFPLPG